MEFIKKNLAFYITALFIIFTGVFIRLGLYWQNFSFWHDEALLALNIIRLNYGDFFHVIENVQIAPPLFMIISKFLYSISNCNNNIYLRDLILRLFPLFAGVIAVPLFTYTTHRAFKNKYITLISILIISFNPAAINYSQEFKQYSSDLLISIVLFLSFAQLDYKTASLKKLGLLSILFCLSLFLSYTSVFILAAGFLYIIFDIIKNKLFNKTKFFILFTPFIFCAAGLFAHTKEVSEKYFELMQWHWTYIERSFLTFDNFLYMFQNKTHALIPFLPSKAIIPILIISSIILIFKNNKKIAFLTLAPVILCIFACLLKKYPYEQRLILFLLPYFAIILSQFAIFIKDIKPIKYAVCLVCVLLSIYQFAIPYDKRDIHYSNAREYTQILIDNNIKQENLLAISSLSKYYLYPKFQMQIQVYNDIWKGFNQNSFEAKLNTMPFNEDLWLMAPREMPDFYEDTLTEIKNFMENNKKYKILKTITTKNDKSYLIRFKKVAN